MIVNNDKAKQALAQASPQQTLQQLIEKSTKEFKKALPVHMRPERLVRIALTCIRQTPELAQCNPASFVGALLVSAQLGLEPVAGRAYILPFWNAKANRKDAQFITGYKGLADLFYRHEKAVQLNWGIVKKNDEFDFEYGTQAKLRHRPTMQDRGEVIGYYVIAELQGGAKPFLYMSKEDCLEHGKKHSKTYDSKSNKFSPYSPWFTDPDAMCLKTVLIQLSKVLPLSIELQKAIQADETSREYREGIDDALDIPAQDWQNDDKTPPAIANTSTGQESATTSPKTQNKGIGEGSPIVKGTISEAQNNAIRELAKKRYGAKWDEELLNRVGNLGFEALCAISKEQAAELIRELGKEIKDAE